MKVFKYICIVVVFCLLLSSCGDDRSIFYSGHHGYKHHGYKHYECKQCEPTTSKDFWCLNYPKHNCKKGKCHK